MNKIKYNLTLDKNENKTITTNNDIIKKNINNNYFNNLNNSAKLVSNGIAKKFKTFLHKKKKISKSNKNHSSQKNLLSINILNHIKGEKYKTNNKFYRTLKSKNSSDINNNNNYKIVHLKNNKMTLLKSPTIKNKKINNLKKNNIGKENNINNNIGIKKKEEKKDNYLSSFSIKVNKTNLNKDKDKENNKNLKKNLNSNMKNNMK